MSMLTATHRVVRFDTRGHGGSSAPDGPYSMEALVTDIVGLMDEVGVEAADFVGLSLGGMLGLGLALDHPDRIGRLICCSARADSPAKYAEFWAERVETVNRQGLSSVVDSTLERWFTQPFLSNDESADTIALTREMILSTSVQGYCGCAAALIGLDYLRRLEGIDLPVLYIAGADDMAAPEDVVRNMARSTPNSEFVVIDGAAHLVNLEQSERFNNTVESWLRCGTA